MLYLFVSTSSLRAKPTRKEKVGVMRHRLTPRHEVTLFRQKAISHRSLDRSSIHSAMNDPNYFGGACPVELPLWAADDAELAAGTNCSRSCLFARMNDGSYSNHTGPSYCEAGATFAVIGLVLCMASHVNLHRNCRSISSMSYGTSLIQSTRRLHTGWCQCGSLLLEW